jgi:hypothetical protein
MARVPDRLSARPKSTLEGTATGFDKGQPLNEHRINDVDQLINDNADKGAKLLSAMMKKANVPLNVKGGTYLYQPDYNWGDWTNTSFDAYTPNGTRLGYVNKTHPFNPAEPNEYSAGVDNLYALGDKYVSKELNLPLGINAYGEYDGDGTLSASLEVPQKQYYLQALANLLRR